MFSLALVLYSGEAIWLWVLMFQMTILLLSVAGVWLTLRLLRVQQSVSDSRTMSGGTVDMSIALMNRSVLPFCHLTLEVLTVERQVGGGVSRIYAALSPFRKVTFDLPMQCRYRGEYFVGITTVEACDWFGLVRYKADVRKLFKHCAPQTVVVYPSPASGGLSFTGYHTDDAASGDSRLPTEELSQIAEIRGYRRGDPLKRIHWKLSARLGELLVKDFDGATSSQNVVLLDCGDHGLSGEVAARLEDMLCSAAAGYTKVYCEAYLPVRLVTYGERRVVVEGGTPAEFEAIHYHLATVLFGGDLPIAQAVGLETEQEVDSLVLVTALPDAAMCERLCALADEGRHIGVAVIDGEAVRDSRIVERLGEHGVEVTLVGGDGDE